ncbi:hypothetical protein BBP40_002376 [Aspergillus hancockii]|nr:hypothetical protein BBP40_002376 [Aspergillus hancockii]
MAQPYSIYSSDAAHSEDDHSQVLPAGSAADNLVRLFNFPSTKQKKVIVLSATPEPGVDAIFEESYGWVQWLRTFDPAGTFSLLRDNHQALQSFKFKLTLNKQWTTTFSSATASLQDAFGDDSKKIEVPGVIPGISGMSLLCCGLVSPATALTATVEQLFIFTGQSRMAKLIPAIARAWTAKLDASNYKGKRNALWFDPSWGLQTTIRLQFALEDKDALQTMIATALPGLTITSADVVCRKILTQGQTVQGLVGVDQGGVVFSVECSVGSVKLVAGVDFKESGITLTLTALDKEALDGILSWLGGVVSLDLTFLKGLINPPEDTDNVFEGLALRQITVDLESTSDPEKHRLSRFRMDLEVAGNFGQEASGSKPVFLASYLWMRGSGKLGSIQAELWSGFDDSAPALQPYYEPWTNLRPLTEDPGRSINLETLVPNQKIDIPSNIPSSIKRATVVLSQKQVAFGATIQSKPVEEGDVPQPYLGLVSLDAFYEWGKSSQFDFKLRVLAGIKPDVSSRHQESALLIGDVVYERSG